MINRVGDSRPGSAGALRAGGGNPAAAPAAPGRPAEPKAEGAGRLVAEMVAKGAPVDAAKVSAIKTAIAEGRYPVDPARIAEGMIALGLGPRA